MSLLEDIRQVAGAIAPGEAPEHGEIASFVGALIKTLDDAGVKVGDELLAQAKAAVQPAPATPVTVTSADQTRLAGLMERLEAALKVAEGKEPEPEA